MGLSHKDVCERYAARQVNTRTGGVYWIGNNIWCDDEFLYSYGTHWPLAKHLGILDGGNFFVKNGDKYSKSTSHHKSMTDTACRGPVISRSQLVAVTSTPDTPGLDLTKITLKNVVCWQERFSQFGYHDTQTGRYYEEVHLRRGLNWGDLTPNSKDEWFLGALEEFLTEGEWEPSSLLGGRFVPTNKKKQDRFVSGTWTVPGYLVLKYNRRYVLCTDDLKDGLSVKLVWKKNPKNLAEAVAAAR